MNVNKILQRFSRHSDSYAKYSLSRRIKKLVYSYLRVVCSMDISYHMTGVYVCHNGFGIVINPNAKIGRGTIIQHSVTIGEMSSSHQAPIIGENCYIGARAMVLGNIKIGNNVKIGAGAVVIDDVPDNCTVV